MWLPSFFTEAGLRDLGNLVVMDFVLSGERFSGYAAHLSPQDQQSARAILENQRAALREKMVSAQLSRNVVNARINRIRRVVKWGVENELVEPSALQALQAVATLKKGRTTARETEAVKPVPDAHIHRVLALVTPHVQAMIELQRLLNKQLFLLRIMINE